METKDIDLTKCRNERARIRYRYGFDESSVYDATGYIEQVKDGWVHLVDDEDEGFIPLWHDGKIDENIMTFEIMPRNPETYRDWQVGDKVTCPDEKWNNIATLEVIFRSGELVALKDLDGCCYDCYTCQELLQKGYRLVLTDIEKQIIEEKKKAEWEPQDGDICFVKTSAGNRFIFIKRDNESDDEIHGYASISTKSRVLYLSSLSCLCDRESIRNFRPATDEEKQLLFDAMAKKGKRWNAEKKVVEDIPKPYEFKNGEPVLVRSDRTHCWQLRAISLSVYGNPPKVEVTDGCDEWIYWIDKDEVIPYNERTMHLLGTSNDYVEE